MVIDTIHTTFTGNADPAPMNAEVIHRVGRLSGTGENLLEFINTPSENLQKKADALTLCAALSSIDSSAKLADIVAQGLPAPSPDGGGGGGGSGGGGGGGGGGGDASSGGGCCEIM